MSGSEAVADTNAVLYFMSGNDCMNAFLHTHFTLSIISRIELLSWGGLTDNEEQQIRKMLAHCFICNITQDIEKKTIELRRTYNIKLPDAVIAATAICNGLPLLSADAVFSRVNGLNFVRLIPTAIGG